MSEELHITPVYAGFWRRVAAALIDGCLLLTLLLLLSHSAGKPGFLLREDWLPSLLAALLGLAYAAGFESSAWQATPGKRLIGIKVTDLAGNRISPGRAILRHLGQFLSAAFLMLGYVMAAFTRRRQCLHDLLAGTLVVRQAFSPEQIQFAPPAPAWSRWQIVAVVAPLVASWLALLSLGLERPPSLSQASPSRNSYHARTEVAAALYYASDAIDRAEALYGESSDFATVNIPSVELDPEAARTISALGVVAGSIHITFGREAETVLQGHTATLTPAVDAEGNITWVCGYADVPEGYDIVHEDYRSLTDIDAAALPPDCLPDDGATPATDAAGLTA
jgi:uncharacterized RDD family membrane protein YckC